MLLCDKSGDKITKTWHEKSLLFVGGFGRWFKLAHHDSYASTK
jgi:hypothetical protein